MRLSLPLSVSALLIAGCASEPDTAPKEDRIEVRGGAMTGTAGPAPEEAKGQPFVSTVLGSLDFALASATRLESVADAPAGARGNARQLAAAATAAREELATIASAERLSFTPTPGSTHQTDLAVLSSATGMSLGKAFAAQQVDALTLLIGTMRAYKNGGDNERLRAWADKHQATLNDRLLDIQTLNAELETATLPADQR